MPAPKTHQSPSTPRVSRRPRRAGLAGPFGPGAGHEIVAGGPTSVLIARITDLATTIRDLTESGLQRGGRSTTPILIIHSFLTQPGSTSGADGVDAFGDRLVAEAKRPGDRLVAHPEFAEVCEGLSVD